MTRRHDVRRIKQHLSFSTSQIAGLLDVRVATVRRWIREGLELIDNHKPYLIAGAALAQFLAARNKPRQKLAPGEIYCVACKRPIMPAGLEANLEVRSKTTGDLVGRCPHSGHRVYRRVCLLEVTEKAGPLVVRYEDATVPVSTDRDPARSDSCAEVAL